MQQLGTAQDGLGWAGTKAAQQERERPLVAEEWTAVRDCIRQPLCHEVDREERQAKRLVRGVRKLDGRRTASAVRPVREAALLT